MPLLRTTDRSNIGAVRSNNPRFPGDVPGPDLGELQAPFDASARSAADVFEFNQGQINKAVEAILQQQGANTTSINPLIQGLNNFNAFGPQLQRVAENLKFNPFSDEIRQAALQGISNQAISSGQQAGRQADISAANRGLLNSTQALQNQQAAQNATNNAITQADTNLRIQQQQQNINANNVIASILGQQALGASGQALRGQLGAGDLAGKLAGVNSILAGQGAGIQAGFQQTPIDFTTPFLVNRALETSDQALQNEQDATAPNPVNDLVVGILQGIAATNPGAPLLQGLGTIGAGFFQQNPVGQ